MKKPHTIVIVGGGYAGINLLEVLREEFFYQLKNEEMKIVLVDRHDYHLKKVKLFKAVVEPTDTNLKVPFSTYCGSDIEFIQGTITEISGRCIRIQVGDDQVKEIPYDQLVLALGSVMHEMADDCGGTTLSNLQVAKKIREELLQEIRTARTSFRVAICGGGITGVETASELVTWLREEALKLGINPSIVEVLLINDKERLLVDIPKKASKKLETILNHLGVKTLHERKVKKFSGEKLIFHDGTSLDADYCIWTVGVKPHPSLKRLGLSLLENGKVKTDSYYRVSNSKNIYAIGDCAHVVDPISGKVAGMSCKEAINQAKRLVKIMDADLQGNAPKPHCSYPNMHCIGLGKGNGFVWVQKWGVDFVITGKLAARVREYTWNMASLFE